jgi:hypothetical protein
MRDAVKKANDAGEQHPVVLRVPLSPCCIRVGGSVPTFRRKATKNRLEAAVCILGDAWCFIGIERHSKLVLCFGLGKRTETSAGRFMGKLAAATHPEKRFVNHRRTRGL